MSKSQVISLKPGKNPPTLPNLVSPVPIQNQLQLNLALKSKGHKNKVVKFLDDTQINMYIYIFLLLTTDPNILAEDSPLL